MTKLYMTMTTMMNGCNNDGDDCSHSTSSTDDDVAFASIDFAGVNFDAVEAEGALSESDAKALSLEPLVVFSEYPTLKDDGDEGSMLGSLYKLLSTGQYIHALSSPTAQEFFNGIIHDSSNNDGDKNKQTTMSSLLRSRVLNYADTIESSMVVELLAVAALNLFLQLNYTGPSLEKSHVDPAMSDNDEEDPLATVNPHSCFASFCGNTDDLQTQTTTSTSSRDNVFHNNVLSELAVDGEWPCQVCQAPYFLLLGRCLFSALSSGDDVEATRHLQAVHLWNARATIAHARLLQTSGDTNTTLWNEAKQSFSHALEHYCSNVDTSKMTNWNDRHRAATVVLEWGLAHVYFNRADQGKLYFHKAMEYSGLSIEITGASGKRTKYQQDSKAQMVVRATSATIDGVNESDNCGDTMNESEGNNDDKTLNVAAPAQMIEHGEDGILLEKIKFDDEKENQVSPLSTLDQAILLAYCLDVKSNNPADGLTAEQMGAYLARVLEQHDDWMIYSTALLERAWLECERPQGRERAILQIQALVDQHSNRLAITQSTFESIEGNESSAPPQERLRNLHSIVYPPRWAMLRDLAERYAKLGVVTTAAEMFAEIEMWDQVVECYQHAGKSRQAEELVRERLATEETPRMWAALGDLTNDPSCYEKALELSNGRYSDAHVALGKYYFEKGDIEHAADYYSKALKIRPLMPHVWFRVGTISMQLGRWKEALNAFSEVVQQEPEEADAWANVAAVHMHNRMPAEAYPALNEVRLSLGLFSFEFDARDSCRVI